MICCELVKLVYLHQRAHGCGGDKYAVIRTLTLHLDTIPLPVYFDLLVLNKFDGGVVIVRVRVRLSTSLAMHLKSCSWWYGWHWCPHS